MAQSRQIVPDGFIRQLEGVFGSKNVSTDPSTVKTYSADYSWFSPLLGQRVRGAVADAVVWANSPDQLDQLLRIAHESGVPVVARGAGTGNYAQCVPIYGGVVVDITRMNRILHVEGGHVTAQPGARLGEIKLAAETKGLTLRLYPSTYLVSSVAGFVEGGSGGVGSVQFGRLWDNNVEAVKLVSPTGGEEEVCGPALGGVIHSAGTTGLLTEVTVPLMVKPELLGVVAGFHTLEAALGFALRLAGAERFTKRVISVYEPAVAQLFVGSVRDRLLRGHMEAFDALGSLYLVIAIFEAKGEGEVNGMLGGHGAVRAEWLGGNDAELLSDYTFNHTTLWATKKKRVTWQHLFLEAHKAVRHTALLKQKYKDNILMHYEVIRRAGRPTVAALPLVLYDKPEQLVDMLQYMTTIGAEVENIHSYQLEDRLDAANLELIRRLKRVNDPKNILNPGKLRSF